MRIKRAQSCLHRLALGEELVQWKCAVESVLKCLAAALRNRAPDSVLIATSRLRSVITQVRGVRLDPQSQHFVEELSRLCVLIGRHLPQARLSF